MKPKTALRLIVIIAILTIILVLLLYPEKKTGVNQTIQKGILYTTTWYKGEIINHCVDTIRTKSGYVEKGVYHINHSLKLKDYGYIKGENRDSCIIISESDIKKLRYAEGMKLIEIFKSENYGNSRKCD